MANEAKGAKSQSAEAASQDASLLDQVIGQTRSRNDEQREESRRQISTLVEEVLQGLKISKDLETTINARIAEIDQLLSKQLNEIMHQPEFQKLEATWRGLNYLVHQSETSTMLKIRVLNVSKKDLLDGPRARARVRPERAVQEGLRGGVRHLRRRPLRGADRRLRVRPDEPGRRAAGEDLERGRGGPRAVHRRGRSRSAQPGVLHRARPRRATWPRSSRASSTPSGSRSASPRTRATSACACRTC